MVQFSGEFKRAYDLMEQDYADCRSEIEAIVENGPEREKVLNKLIAKFEPTRKIRMQELGEMAAGFSDLKKCCT